MEELPPTAQRLLAAARRLLVRDGFTALTLSAIADEARSPRQASAITSATRMDWWQRWSTPSPTTRTEPSSKSAVHCRLGRPECRLCWRASPRIVADSSSLPGFLRGAALRASGPALSDGAWRLSTTAIARPCGAASATPIQDKGPELRSFCALMIAIVDGLAIQYCLDPEGADVASVIRQWGRLVLPAGKTET